MSLSSPHDMVCLEVYFTRHTSFLVFNVCMEFYIIFTLKPFITLYLKCISLSENNNYAWLK